MQTGYIILAVAAEISDLDDRRVIVRMDAHALCRQRHVIALDIGRLPLGLGAGTRFLVHKGHAQGAQHLLLGPCVLGIINFFHHGLISRVLCQILIGALVVGHGHVAGIVLGYRLREHIRELAAALVAGEIAVLVGGFVFIIGLLLGNALVSSIILHILGHRIIGGAVRLGEHSRILRICAFFLEVIPLLVHIPAIGDEIIIGLGYNLLIVLVLIQIFAHGGEIGPFAGFFIYRLREPRLNFLAAVELVIQLRNSFRVALLAVLIQRLIGGILLQVRFRALVDMRLAVLSLVREHLPQGELFFTVIQGLELAILALNPFLVIGRVLLQFLHVGAFVVFGASDEAGIDPLVDHVVGADVVVTVRRGPCIDEPAAFCRHVYVAVFGNDGAYSHIPFVFLQVDMALRLSIDAGGVLAFGAADILAGLNNDSLDRCETLDRPVPVQLFLKGTNGRIGAGQGDFLALYRNSIVLGKPGKLLLRLFRINLLFDTG